VKRARLLPSSVISFALLWLLLVGPAPGAVGSCGGDDLTGEAELIPYCQEREELICERKRRRGELTDEGAQTCRHEVRELCEHRFFPNECRPTERVAQACLNALRSLDTVKTKEKDIPECRVKALCAIRGSAVASTPTVDGGL